MRCPTDRSLASWIRELIAEGRLYRFYKSQDFRELRAQVLRDYHNECKRCRDRGKYTRAKVVHHVHEVRDRPDLALTRWVREPDGTITENLIPLCQNCHEIEHGRAYEGRDNTNHERLREIEEKYPERW